MSQKEVIRSQVLDLVNEGNITFGDRSWVVTLLMRDHVVFIVLNLG